MGKVPPYKQTLSRLLGLKRSLDESLGVAPAVRPESAGDEAESPQPVNCINCGYQQQGQRSDRCPECGLPFASRLRDPTTWAAPGQRAVAWLETAKRVWTWDYRIRVRTSIVPGAPESSGFAWWSIGLSAMIAGLAVPLSNYDPQAPASLSASMFILQGCFGILLAGVLLAATRLALKSVLRGIWRTRLRFIPASVDYATAWWPVLSLLLLACAVPIPEFDPLLKTLLLTCGVWAWAFWLWSSASESQHIRYVSLRIAGVTLGSLWLGTLLAGVIPGTSRGLMLKALSRADSVLTRVNGFATIAGTPAGDAPRTLAIVIDAIPGVDAPIIAKGIEKLGASPGHTAVLRGEACTLEQIDRALKAASNDLRPQDRFILYINGHGSRYGAGSIRMADGEITSQKLSELLSNIRTDNNLVVIDSCFGGKFVPSLRSAIDAIVVTCTDNENVGYGMGMFEFWHALGSPQADGDGDGRTTVEEAFWCAYRPMLRDGENSRQALLARSTQPEDTAVLTSAGAATPQLERSRNTREDVFVVPVKSGN